MRNSWQEVKKELDRMADTSLTDLADEIVSYDKAMDEYRKALAGKAIKDMDGDLITINRHKLDQMLDKSDCRVCPLYSCYLKGPGLPVCRERLIKWLADEWDEGDYREEDKG